MQEIVNDRRNGEHEKRVKFYYLLLGVTVTVLEDE